MARKESSPVAVEPVRLTAIEPVQYDGAPVAPGESFTASPDVAQALIAAGAAEISASE